MLICHKHVDCHKQGLLMKMSNLEFFFPGTVVVHDAHVMVVGLVVHDQTVNTWETKVLDILQIPKCDKYFCAKPSCPSSVNGQKTPSVFFSANDSGYFLPSFLANPSLDPLLLATYRKHKNWFQINKKNVTVHFQAFFLNQMLKKYRLSSFGQFWPLSNNGIMTPDNSVQVSCPHPSSDSEPVIMGKR